MNPNERDTRVHELLKKYHVDCEENGRVYGNAIGFFNALDELYGTTPAPLPVESMGDLYNDDY